MQRGNLRDCWGVSLVYRQVQQDCMLYTSTHTGATSQDVKKAKKRYFYPLHIFLTTYTFCAWLGITMCAKKLKVII